MGVRGDSARLDKLIRTMDRLARGSVAELAGVLGEQALELVDEGFERGRAPSGRRWPQPAYRSGPPMILSGRLRRSYVLRLRTHGFEIVSRTPYAAKLQRLGRRTVPNEADITARWDRAMRERADAWMERQIG